MLLYIAEASVKLKVPSPKDNLGDDSKNNSVFNIYVCMY